MCLSLHKLRDDVDPSDFFIRQLVVENSCRLNNGLTLTVVRKILWEDGSYLIFHLSSPLQQDDTIFCDFGKNSRNKLRGYCDNHCALATHDTEWLQSFHPSTLMFREASLCIIEPYWPS